MRNILSASLLLGLVACGGGGGGTGSTPTPTPTNQSPVSDAGSDVTVALSSQGISLDGSNSRDPDGDALTFQWSIVSQPSGADAQFDDASLAATRLQTLVPGAYELELTVNDGRGASAVDPVTLDLTNTDPVLVIDPVPEMVAVGEVVTFNATGSSDSNGHGLTYAWSVVSAPTGSNLASVFDGSVVEAGFDVEGQFVVRVDVSDGFATVSETLTFTVDEFATTILAQGFVYAETDTWGDIFVTSIEDDIHVLNAEGAEQASYELGKTVTHLSVSPDGEWIGAAHTDAVSMIKVSDGSLYGPWPLTREEPGDLVIDNNGDVHVIPIRDQWVSSYSVDAETGAETGGQGFSVRAGTVMRMHPNGAKIYGANRGLSPSDIERHDIVNGSLQLRYDSPYHGDYPMNGNLWITEDGNYIVVASGVVFRATEAQSTDMTFVVQLDRQGAILDVAYDENRNYFYVVEQVNSATHLNVYDASSGRFLSRLDLPEIVDGSGLETQALSVSIDAQGQAVRILTSDHFSNPQSFAMMKRYFIAPDLLDYAPETRVPGYMAGMVGEEVVLDASASFDPEGQPVSYSWALESEPAVSALVLPTLNEAALRFTPVAAGDYVFSLVTSDGGREAASVTMAVHVVDAGGVLQLRLTGQPSDIVYNKIRNQILYTSSVSERLHIRNLDNYSEQIVDLPGVGERLDVSPNGDYVAVSHSGAASLVDLRPSTPSVVDEQGVAADWGDIAVDDNAVAYLIPNRDQWVSFHAIDFLNDNVTSRGSAYAGAQVRMHPQGGKVYSASRGLSPSDIEKWTVTDLENITNRDSPYHGDYPMNGNVWISEAGNRLVVAGGHVFQASDDPGLDMTYVAPLSTGSAVWADHSTEAGDWVVTRSDGVSVLLDTTYDGARSVSVEALHFDSSGTAPTLDQTYFSDDGSKLMVISHVAGMTMDNFAVQIHDAP